MRSRPRPTPLPSRFGPLGVASTSPPTYPSLPRVVANTGRIVVAITLGATHVRHAPGRVAPVALPRALGKPSSQARLADHERRMERYREWSAPKRPSQETRGVTSDDPPTDTECSGPGAPNHDV